MYALRKDPVKQDLQMPLPDLRSRPRKDLHSVCYRRQKMWKLALRAGDRWNASPGRNSFKYGMLARAVTCAIGFLILGSSGSPVQKTCAFPMIPGERRQNLRGLGKSTVLFSLDCVRSKWKEENALLDVLGDFMRLFSSLLRYQQVLAIKAQETETLAHLYLVGSWSTGY